MVYNLGATFDGGFSRGELLSPTTEAKDRGKKFGWYRACPDIQEYMLVAAEYQEVQVYQREQHNLWTLRNFGPGDTVTLARLGISIPVAEIYEDTFFPQE